MKKAIVDDVDWVLLLSFCRWGEQGDCVLTVKTAKVDVFCGGFGGDVAVLMR